MINRTLIRIRVLQELFAYYHNPGKQLAEAEAQLNTSNERTHDLYLHLLTLIPTLTRFHQARLERRRNKLLRTEEDINPNMRLANNRLAQAMEASTTLQEFIRERGLIWSDDDRLLSTLLDEILASDLYREYVTSAPDTFAADAKFWVQAFAGYTFRNEELDEYLEGLSLYWDNPLGVTEKIEVEDKVDIEEVDEVVAGLKGTEYYHAVRLASSPVEIEKEFALKSMRKAKPDTSFDEVIIPAYKDEEDTHLAAELLRTTIVHEEEYREIINKNLRNWDMDRVTDVDMIILQMALAELLSFPTIPTTVTLNEYIELAKIYSTAESGVFVNGLLDSALHQLRDERRILKF